VTVDVCGQEPHMRKLAILFVVLVLIASVAGRQTDAPPVGSVSEPVLMQQLLKQFNVPGVSIAVIRDFKIVLAVAYGVADVETGAP